MKLEVGKKYVCRNGEVVGPLEVREDCQYPFACPVSIRGYKSMSWRPDGRWSVIDDGSEFDIISEYTEPAPPPQWKWMVPNRAGVWMWGGSRKDERVCCEVSVVPQSRVATAESEEGYVTGWWCFICDPTQILEPEKKVVKKRLYVRRERAPLDCSPPEIEHLWITDKSQQVAPEESGWSSTELVEEFEE